MVAVISERIDPKLSMALTCYQNCSGFLGLRNSEEQCSLLEAHRSLRLKKFDMFLWFETSLKA